jgi:hypothetical protein
VFPQVIDDYWWYRNHLDTSLPTWVTCLTRLFAASGKILCTDIDEATYQVVGLPDAGNSC